MSFFAKLWKNFLRHKRRYIYPLVILAAIAVNWIAPWDNSPTPQKTDISTVETAIVNKQVESATLVEYRHVILAQVRGGPLLEAQYVSDAGGDLQDKLLANGVKTDVNPDDRGWLSIVFSMFGWLIPFILIITFLPTLLQHAVATMASGGAKEASKPKERPDERFTDVKGADEAIAELKLVVDSLAKPEEYKNLKLERGVLLHGPPGTGKTLLAKAIAGEAGVPFFRLGGAELVGMFAGQTTANLGSFFKKINKDMQDDKTAPFVVFIDELDGIGTKRTGNSMADRDSNTTVTQLIDQISRLFEEYPNAIVVGASNRFDELDDALVRPGRLGKHIAMPNPDLEARRLILELNSEGFKLTADDMEGAARLTDGLSGAAVAQIPREATQIAVMDSGPGSIPTRHHIERATMQIVMGTLRTSAVIRPDDEAIALAHESGHATIAAASPYHRLLIVTTYPIQDTGGTTWAPPLNMGLFREDAVRWQLALCMGGREAEQLDLKEFSSGGGHDIESATNIALQAICHWGLFMPNPSHIDIRTWRQHPQAAEIQAKVTELIEEASLRASQTLATEHAFRESLKRQLAEARILYSDQLAALSESLLSTTPIEAMPPV